MKNFLKPRCVGIIGAIFGFLFVAALFLAMLLSSINTIFNFKKIYYLAKKNPDYYYFYVVLGLIIFPFLMAYLTPEPKYGVR